MAGRQLIASNTGSRLLLSALLAFIFTFPMLFGSLSMVMALMLALVAGMTVLVSGAGSGFRFCWQPALTVLAAAFVILALVFAFNADEPGDLASVAGFLGLLVPLLLYQYLVRSDHGPTFWQISLYSLAGCLLGLVFVILQRYGLNIERSVAVTAGPNAIARVALVIGFLAPIAVSLDPSRRTQNITLAGPGVAMVILMFSGSRGTLLAFPVVAAIACVFVLRVIWRFSRRLTLAIFATGCIVAAVHIIVDPTGLIALTVNTIANLVTDAAVDMKELDWSNVESDYSSFTRAILLDIAWRAFQDAPLTGHGWAALLDVAKLKEPTEPAVEYIRTYFNYHNDVANFAVAGGLVGLFAYAMIIFAPIVNLVLDPALRRNRRAAYALILLPTGYAVFGVTDFNFGFDLLTSLYGFSLAFVLAAAHSEKVGSKKVPLAPEYPAGQPEPMSGA